MHFPIDIVLGSVVIPSHFVFDVLSLYIGYRYYLYLCARNERILSGEQSFQLLIGAAAGALIGARLLAALENPTLFFHPPSLAYYFLAGKTIVGGLAGGIIGVEIAKKILCIRHSTGAVVTFPIIIALFVGRIGCFLTGVNDATVGIVSVVPWAFDQGDGLPRHPTTLYEMFFLAVLFFALHRLYTARRVSDGALFRLFIIGYFTFRFFVEFIKPVQTIALGSTAIQWVCVLFVVYYLARLLMHKYHYGTK